MSDRDVRLGPVDLHLLGEGTHARLFEKMGAQVTVRDGKKGTQFSVWAPNAETIDVLGDWNDWRPGGTPMRSLGPSGVWQAFAPGAEAGHRYKLHIRSRHDGYTVDKADPFAFASEVPPAKASVIAAMDYSWNDG
ncbi:MAG: 1,4-alpha-glucan branching enzyme, partial [Verrucomicrobiota bacterium]